VQYNKCKIWYIACIILRSIKINVANEKRAKYYVLYVLTDTKDCNCFITLKWKVKVKSSLRYFCKSPFDFCKPIACVGHDDCLFILCLSCCHLTFRKSWYCLIKTRIDLVSLSFSNEIYKKNHVNSISIRPMDNKNMTSDRFACIEYNITNSSWHFEPNGSLWTGQWPTK
jgi:hypothetical protein